MNKKNIISSIYIKNGKAVTNLLCYKIFEDGDVLSLGKHYANTGADGIIVFDLSTSDKEQDQSIGLIKDLAREIPIPIISGGNIKRMEDVKKLLYAGSSMVFLNYAKEGNISLTKEVSMRFGKDKIAACVDSIESIIDHKELLSEWTGKLLLLKEVPLDKISNLSKIINIPLITSSDRSRREELLPFLQIDYVTGLFGSFFNNKARNFTELKYYLKESGIDVNTYESKFSFKDFKLNNEGLIPVIVQDYKTDQVLMLAYMNEDAFNHTLKSGKMTYYSRSRKEQWVKGDTSGHYQYVKSLSLDCDNDTILAKVSQIGAACHTGNMTCFFNTLLEEKYKESNPLKVFEDVYGVILDRKDNPKEGSYTNYLFEKGIDKILKKLGEEATEIVIAAKNPDPEEIKYEISDFLYHVMVLMADKGITWEDITKELARR